MLKKGDKVFYSDNGVVSPNFMSIAFHTIKKLGLIPLVYSGAKQNIKKSNLDREIRDDFYESKLVIIMLGKTNGIESVKDEWVLLEIDHAINLGIQVIIYLTKEISEEEKIGLNFPVKPITIRDLNHFESLLEGNLRRLSAQKNK